MPRSVFVVSEECKGDFRVTDVWSTFEEAAKTILLLGDGTLKKRDIPHAALTLYTTQTWTCADGTTFCITESCLDLALIRASFPRKLPENFIEQLQAEWEEDSSE